MNKSNKVASISIFVLVGFLLFLFFFKPANSNLLSNCYSGKVGSSASLIQIKDHNQSNVSGDLIFYNFEKDSSYGTFNGLVKDGNLQIDFKYWSEGVESTRKINFKISKNALVGEGFNYQSVKDCKTVHYSQGLSLIPYSIELPLYLMPQLSLGYSNLGEPKPDEFVSINYRPAKGNSVTVAQIYYWDSNVWKEIYDPNSPPEFGIPMIEDKDKVLSVSLIQDCYYPNDSDCKNVSELYSLINEKSSYKYLN